jgi:hypothetical protein
VRDAIDIARRSGGAVLGAAEEIHAADSEPIGVRFGCDSLGHAGAPAPMVAGGRPVADGCRYGARARGSRWSENPDRLVEIGVHQHAQHQASARVRHIDDPNDIAERRLLG